MTLNRNPTAYALIAFAFLLLAACVPTVTPDSRTWVGTLNSELGFSVPFILTLDDIGFGTASLPGEPVETTGTAAASITDDEITVLVRIEVDGERLQFTLVGVVDGNLMVGTHDLYDAPGSFVLERR